MYELLKIVKDQFFSTHHITLLGRFSWLPVTDKQRERVFKKAGKELKEQFKRYRIVEVFYPESINVDSDRLSQTGRFYNLLISDLDRSTDIFFVIGDHCMPGGLAGEKMRYKFKVEHYNDIGMPDKFTMTEKKMIAIR